MPIWGRIENNTVCEITDIDPAGRFVPQIEAQFEIVPDDTAQGATRANGVWTNPPPAPEPIEAHPITPPTVYAVLEPATFLGLLLAVGLSKTQLGDARDDVNLRWLWVIFDALQHGVEHPNAGTQGSSLTAEGFSDLVTHGYLSTEQVMAAKANWPTL